jgi:neutral ceramidase
LEKKFTGAEFLFVAGLGGSANPYPRTGLSLAKEHGQELAQEVARTFQGKQRPIEGPLTVVMELAALPLKTFTTEDLKADQPSWMRGAVQEMRDRLARGGTLPKIHKAPVAVWQFGTDLTFVGLSGEVVGEFAPLVVQAIGPLNLWMAGYCNAVSGYIPTRQILREGGYECRGLYEDAGIYAPDAEDILIETVRRLAARAHR